MYPAVSKVVRKLLSRRVVFWGVESGGVLQDSVADDSSFENELVMPVESSPASAGGPSELEHHCQAGLSRAAPFRVARSSPPWQCCSEAWWSSSGGRAAGPAAAAHGCGRGRTRGFRAVFSPPRATVVELILDGACRDWRGPAPPIGLKVRDPRRAPRACVAGSATRVTPCPAGATWVARTCRVFCSVFSCCRARRRGAFACAWSWRSRAAYKVCSSIKTSEKAPSSFGNTAIALASTFFSS